MFDNNGSLKRELRKIVKERACLYENFDCNIDSLGRCVVFNTESVHFFYTSDSYRNYVRSCDRLFLDGAALQLYFKMTGINIARFHGPDLLNRLVETGFFSTHPIAFIGDQEKIERVSQILPITFQLEMDHFKLTEIDMHFNSLNLGAYDFPEQTAFIICLGLPKQEILALKIFSELGTDNNFSILPLGAAIDFLTGEKKRSSKFWTKLGLEWLPRLLREPRMFKRVLRSFNAIIILHFDRSDFG